MASHGGACLPVLELRLRGVCFGRGVCWDGLVLIRLQRKAKRLNQGEIREGIGGKRKKWYNMGIK